MKFHLDFVGIIGDSLQIFIKHKKLMALITLFTLLLNSVIILCNFLSIEPLLNDLVMKETLLLTRSPGSSEYASLPLAVAADFKIIAGVQWLFILAICIVSLLTSTLAILASAITYVGLELNFTDLLSRTVKSLRRPFITLCDIFLLQMGYLFLATMISFPFFLNFSGQFHLSTSFVMVIILVSVLYMYVSVVWNLALVVSVLEEKHGFEAIGKAGQLVKGMKLNGFLLNLLFGVLSFLVFGVSTLVDFKHLQASTIIVGILIANLSCLIKMFLFMAFTIFYDKCKKVHGEEIELQESLEYSKVSLHHEELP